MLRAIITAKNGSGFSVKTSIREADLKRLIEMVGETAEDFCVVNHSPSWEIRVEVRNT